jgi:hypothetical protein
MVDGSRRKRRNRGDVRSKFYATYRQFRFSFLGVESEKRTIIDIRVVCARMGKDKGEKK